MCAVPCAVLAVTRYASAQSPVIEWSVCTDTLGSLAGKFAFSPRAPSHSSFLPVCRVLIDGGRFFCFIICNTYQREGPEGGVSNGIEGEKGVAENHETADGGAAVGQLVRNELSRVSDRPIG